MNDASTLHALDLTVRTFNTLTDNKIKTVKQLCRMTREELFSIESLGNRGIDKIEAQLKKHGLKLSNGKPIEALPRIESNPQRSHLIEVRCDCNCMNETARLISIANANTEKKISALDERISRLNQLARENKPLLGSLQDWLTSKGFLKKSYPGSTE